MGTVTKLQPDENPTAEYEGTRHNVGFDVIDAIADKYNIDVTERKHRAFCGKGLVAGQRVLLVKPQTYMNLSGESIRDIASFYKIPPENIIIQKAWNLRIHQEDLKMNTLFLKLKRLQPLNL